MDILEKFQSLNSIIKTEYVNQTYFLNVEIEELQYLLYYLREHMDYLYLLDIFIIDQTGGRGKGHGHYQLNYLIKNLENETLVCVKSSVTETGVVPSCSIIWPNSFVKEQEAKELVGVPFEFNSDKKILPISKVGYPQRNSHVEFEQGERKFLPMPHVQSLRSEESNALLQNEILWEFEVEEDLIKSIEIHKGFFHLGLEKHFESLNSNQVLMNINRVNTKRSTILETLWCDTIERSYGLEVPDRAFALRMIFLELERIKDHFQFFECLAGEVKFPHMQQVFSKLGSKIVEIFQFYLGNKKISPISCIGGIRFDIPKGWLANINDVLEKIEIVFNDFISSFESSKIWKERLNCGEVDSKMALDFGVTGPNLRASGINYDIRKNAPYYFYSELDFEIPVGQRGTVLDRFLVRAREVTESFIIIAQVLDNIPTGSILHGDFNYFRTVEKQINFDSDKFLKSAREVPKIENNEICNLLEGSNGHQGIFLKGNEDGSIGRFRLFSGDQSALELFSNVVCGNDCEDAMLVYQSFNIHMSEVEK